MSQADEILLVSLAPLLVFALVAIGFTIRDYLED
tara:strand:- start:438 stop:539 length:102 start_codon:yes stop_codon:yes gene_type:complete